MKLFKNIFPILIFALLFSCGNKKDKESVSVPDSVFTVQQMQDVMFDIYMTESYIRQKERDGFPSSYYTKIYYDLLFEKYGTDTSKLMASYRFYSSNPQTFMDINQRVIDSLVVEETKLRK